MKLLVDMNLPPAFADMLIVDCIEAEHWSRVGENDATDIEIMKYALQHNYVVVTCDLDFSAILSATYGQKPSIVQVRARNIAWNILADLVVRAIKQNTVELDKGAVLTLDTKKSRVRLLPL
jgi:predicted nuclease of predicted toxin-antitoxin system